MTPLETLIYWELIAAFCAIVITLFDIDKRIYRLFISNPYDTRHFYKKLWYVVKRIDDERTKKHNNWI